jgi:spermidine/putrescine transport system permease protein
MNRSKKLAYLLLTPSLLWFFFFMLVPIGMITFISFTTNDGYGGTLYQFSLEAYAEVFDTLYARIFVRSVAWALFVTIACLLIGYPFAYFLAHTKKWKNVLLFLVIIPFWTNLLIRTYAWIILLKGDGVINSALMGSGILSEPLALLFTPFSVIIGLIYGFLPFMVLPLFTSIEKLDHTYLEAAEDLGARPAQAFFRVTVPLTLPGIAAGCLLTFIPALGIFVIPDLLGGAKSMMIGNVIRDDFMVNMNWQLGAAVSVVLTILVLTCISVFTRFFSDKSTV